MMHVDADRVAAAALAALPAESAARIIRQCDNRQLAEGFKALGVKSGPKFISGGSTAHARRLLLRLDNPVEHPAFRVFTHHLVDHARVTIGDADADNPSQAQVLDAARGIAAEHGWEAAVLLIAFVAGTKMNAAAICQNLLDGYDDPDDAQLHTALLHAATPGSGVPDRLPGTDPSPVQDDPADNPPGDTAPQPETDELQDTSGGIAQPVTATSLFTPLDNAIIRAARDSALGAVGAAPRDDHIRLVDELIASTPDRHASWFHAGFAVGIDAANPVQPAHHPDTVVGDNAARRHWWMLGVLLGARRAGDTASIITNAIERTELALSVVADPTSGDAVTAAVCDALLDHPQQQPLAATVLDARTTPFDGGGETLARFAAAARSALGRRDTGTAELLVDAAIRHATDRVPPSTLADLTAIRSAVLRAAGRFEDARDLLETTDTAGLAPAARAHLTLEDALVAAEVRHLPDIESPSDAPADQIVGRLSCARERLEHARVLDRRNGPAAYLLGLLAWADGDWATADTLLDVAATGLAATPTTSDTRLPAEALGLRGLAALRAGGAAREAIRHLTDATTAGNAPAWDPPTGLLVDTAAALVNRGSSAAGPFLTWAVDTTGDLRAFLPCVTAALTGDNRYAIGHAVDMLKTSSLTPSDRYHVATAVMDCATTDDTAYESSVAHAETAAADTTDAAIRHDWTGRLDIDERLRAHMGDTADAARIRLHIVHAEPVAAAGVAQTVFWRWSARPDNTTDPHELIELVERYGNGQVDPAPMRAALPTEETSDADTADLTGRTWRLLFVGGEEGSEEASIRRAAANLEADGISLDFTWRTGWGYGYKPFLDKLRDAPEHHRPHAVVLERHMQTHLGRHLRSLLGDQNIPWVGLYTLSQTGAQRAMRRILRVAATRTGR